VLVDDLVTLGTSEPYRMFTSRAEYRLLLREDNADLRLTPSGRELGLVDDERWAAYCTKRDGMEREVQRLEQTWVRPGTPQAEAFSALGERVLGREYRLIDLLKRPEVTYRDIVAICGDAGVGAEVAEQVEIQAKYAGYIDRQQEEVDRMRRYENTALSGDFDYAAVDGLSHEVRHKLQAACPATLAQAGRIPGVTPAAISLLLIHLKKRGWLDRRTA
jgi:tRNA uridine 5-carboxymethylaminomethyl modification enzyme